MSVQDDLRAVAGKAVADPEFRQKLIEDPEAAVKEVGIELTPEQIQALKEMDKEQFELAVSELDERLTMGCWAYAPIKPATPIEIPRVICGWR